MKLIERLKNQWRIYMGVSSKFRKIRRYNDYRDFDWYYQHSWFSSYFYEKLKRKTMDIIYHYYSKIEDYLLTDFLFELEFYTTKSNKLDEYNLKHKKNHSGDFKCYLPLIIKARELSEAELITIAIRTELEQYFGITSIGFKVEKITDKDYLKTLIQNINTKLDNSDIGYVTINNFTPQKIGNKLDLKTDKKIFRVVKSGPLPYRQNFDYYVNFTKILPDEG